MVTPQGKVMWAVMIAGLLLLATSTPVEAQSCCAYPTYRPNGGVAYSEDCELFVYKLQQNHASPDSLTFVKPEVGSLLPDIDIDVVTTSPMTTTTLRTLTAKTDAACSILVFFSPVCPPNRYVSDLTSIHWKNRFDRKRVKISLRSTGGSGSQVLPFACAPTVCLAGRYLKCNASY